MRSALALLAGLSLAIASEAEAVSPLPPCFVGPWDVTFTDLGISYGYGSAVGHRIESASRGKLVIHSFGHEPATAPYWKRRCHFKSAVRLPKAVATDAEAIVVDQTRRVMQCAGIKQGRGSPRDSLYGQSANFRKAFAILKGVLENSRRPIDWSKCKHA